jgi:hypothetical protein
MHGIMDSQRAALKAGNELRYTVLRKNSNDVYEEKELTSIITPIQSATSYNLRFSESANEEQLSIRKKWLSKQK